MISNGLKNSSFGVNAQMNLIPTGSIDVIATQVVEIDDETRNSSIAAESYTGPYPAIIVWQADQVVINQRNSTGSRDADFSISISYRNRAMPQHVGVTTGLFTMRAVQKCIEALFDNENEAHRSLNGIQLLSYTTMTQTPVIIDPADNCVTATVTVVINVRDIIL